MKLKSLLKKLKVDGANNNELYSEKSEGEDWEGFNKLMRSSEIKDRRRITKIVNSVEDLELRERAIRDMAEIYDAIEKNIFGGTGIGYGRGHRNGGRAGTFPPQGEAAFEFHQGVPGQSAANPAPV